MISQCPVIDKIMMEGVGVEISLKIKSAIKAKLMEIGAFVDDELPDYIMVMVANKRTKAQMDDELNLFLGNNTNHFTTWLHSVLEQLKQVTLISQAKKADSAKRKASVNGSNSAEPKRKKKDKEGKESSNPAVAASSSSLSTDIQDKIKEELMNEYSKENVAVSKLNSDPSSKNRRTSETNVKSSMELDITEIDLEPYDEDEPSVRRKSSSSVKNSEHSSGAPEITSNDKKISSEVLAEKKTTNDGKKDKVEATQDKEDSLSLELSSDENEYINIKNDDIFLSGDEDSYRAPASKSVASKISDSKYSNIKSRDKDRKSFDKKSSSKKHSSSREVSSKDEKSNSKKFKSSVREDHKNKNSLDREKDIELSRNIEQDFPKKLSVSKNIAAKKVVDAREVLNWKRNMKHLSSAENEKPSEEKSRSIFDRLSNTKTNEPSSKDSKSKPSESSRAKEDSGPSRIFLKRSLNVINSKPDISGKRTESSSNMKDSKSNSGNQPKRQIISLSQVAQSEREILNQSQNVSSMKSKTVSRNQSQEKKREKPENRIASRVIAKEPESDIEEIVTDVPSVVKVTPRPVIPASKAAPRNLILRAVAEAEKSVQSSPGRSDKGDGSSDEDLVILNQVKAETVSNKAAVAALETTLQFLKQNGADAKDISVIRYWLYFAKLESEKDT